MNQMALFPDHQFKDPVILKDFILAGKAKITIRSEKTLKHHTYKIKREKDNPIWYVARLMPENQYEYMGTIFEDQIFRPTRKTKRWVVNMPWFNAFDWFWRILSQEVRMPPNVTVFHEGRCGMCGLELTDPVSIKEGYGPDCRKKRVRHDP